MECLPDGSFSVMEKKVKYGKISGTRMPGLLGKSKWDTPFTVTAKLLRLYNEDISDKKEVKAGVEIEGKILEYIGAIPGDIMFSKREGNHEDWESDFKDDIFAGHIDGTMPDGSIVEVKTTKNPEDWLNGPPVYYWIQASLYAHFMGTDKIIFAVGFTDEKTLADPSSWVPSEKTLARFDVPIIKGFDEMLVNAREVYSQTVLQGHTAVPDPTNPMDRKVMNILKCQIWDEKEAVSELDEIVKMQSELDEMKALEKMIQDRKELMGMYMSTHDLDQIQGRTHSIKRTSVTRSVVDTDALKRDGIYDLYQKTSTSEMLKITRRK